MAATFSVRSLPRAHFQHQTRSNSQKSARVQPAIGSSHFIVSSAQRLKCTRLSRSGAKSHICRSTRAEQGRDLSPSRDVSPNRNVKTEATAREVEPTAPEVTTAMGPDVTSFQRVQILSEALPYIQKFRGRTVVVKYGGAAMKDPTLKEQVVRDVVLLSCLGIRPILVHGGGPEINSWLTKLGIEPNFKNGLRVTDAATMEVVEMVLVGKVNKSIVSLINQAGGKAVGLCGKDGDLIRARQMTAGDLGFVGDVTGINTDILVGMVQDGIIPVIASVAADSDGQALNINADLVAGEIAAGMDAEKLILMTDVPGVLLDKDDLSTIISHSTISQMREYKQDGTLVGGMIPKVECCVRSLAQGVSATHIIDGRTPHSLLMEILTADGCGTMIVG
mmetsp:Transcript_16483/g.19770  ORF Transcript_16483/g.19770 Transcript_16483/m.19770 type:complete len:391 (-) Transcript_16483:279-1451(-)|eukprot:CAMPEP_0197849010 /NCGR_PEP_ID=MMETSP1438-20131217/10592_1 /TAXON_ID=1461541 /ORGANISM="Pterosperma sp., Strain CCMP1384" /LENGTH=390 /DNA_ID=CAMNT_0043461505 /DNA_START=76 /DNA_END=1248 /DNA_ORIENTATION=-